MTEKKQHVDLYRKLMLRKNLLKVHSPKTIYIPFIGDGDIATELYNCMNIKAADIDPARVATAKSRLPSAEIIKADCNAFPAFAPVERYDGADFDSYSDPYESFRAWWAKGLLADRMTLFFTDGHRQGMIQSGEWITPTGELKKLERIEDRRQVFNFYFPRHILPWFVEFIGKDGYKIIKSAFYLRKMMLYWGAVIDKSPGALVCRDAEKGAAHIKFSAAVRKEYLGLIQQGFRRGAASEQVGITRETVILYKQQHPEFVDQERQAEVDACEIIEDALFEAAKSGNTKAMELYLANRAPERWKEKPIVQMNSAVIVFKDA